jgi:hypothetical protein
MANHVKILGAIYIALSTLSLFVALFLAMAVGTAGAIVGTAADPNDAAIALPILGIAGTALVAFLIIVSLPGLIAGIGLLKMRPWARIVGIVVAILSLLNIPLGTIVGIYGLWVLFSKETEQLLESGVASA